MSTDRKKRYDRINLRIDPELKRQVQEYCYRRHTTITDVVNRFLSRLVEEDKQQEEAPQI